MAHALHDPVRHNAWATTQILEFCRGLDEQTLNATVPGTYGTIIATLRHIIYCEGDHLHRAHARAANRRLVSVLKNRAGLPNII